MDILVKLGCIFTHICMHIGADEYDSHFSDVFDDVLHAINGNDAYTLQHTANHVITGTCR